jgi:hypothetical protein
VPAPGAQDANPLAGEHGIEHASELAVAIPNQQPELSRTVTKIHQKIPRLLSNPAATEVGGEPHASGSTKSRHEQHRQPLQQQCVDADKSVA